MLGGNENGTVANAPAPFLSKTYDMVDDPSTDSIVSWGKNGNSFVAWNDAECATHLLPKYFKHKNFSSFVRQLNTYGFRKIDSDRWEFANEGFLKGQKHLLKRISRRKPAAVQSHQQLTEVQSTSAASYVEVAKFGIEEDVESLKKDKNILMQELVGLRQQQQATDHQLQTVGQRFQIMEQRQQQMMAFLAKAMQSPGFLSQLIHQQNDSNRRITGGITGGNKKRRLPKQEEEILVNKYRSPSSPDGRIVKYQPLMNEAAKAMLRQILKINASARLEPTISNGNGFLIDGVPSSDVGSSSSRISEVTLSEVPPSPMKSYAAQVVPVSQPPVIISEAQSSPCLASGEATLTQFPQTNVQCTEEGSLLPEFSEVQSIIPESTIEGPGIIFTGSDTGSMDYMHMISGLGDGRIPVAAEDFPSDPDIDILLDENPKLPGINDVFWEQFLSESSLLTNNTDENNFNALEGFGEEEEQENGWDRTKHMNHLTEQMGLLASGSAVV